MAADQKKKKNPVGLFFYFFLSHFDYRGEFEVGLKMIELHRMQSTSQLNEAAS